MTKKQQKQLIKTLKKYHDALLILGICLSVLVGAALKSYPEWVAVKAYELPKLEIVKVNVPVEIPTPINCTTEKCKILAYIVEKFQDDAANAITMIRKCENSTFDPKRVSPLNIQKSGRRSYDVGIFQNNVDEANRDEIERLKDWKYNIDVAYRKYKASGNNFYQWSCAGVINQKSFKDN